jgi:hypothetical protein
MNRDIIESYLIAFSLVRKKVGTNEEYKFLLQEIVKEGVNLVEDKKDFLPECVSTQNFSNSLKLMENLELVKMVKEKDLNWTEILDWNSAGERTKKELELFHQITQTPVEKLLH